MTKTWPMMLAALLFASCAGGNDIPDNIPPAPPAWKGEARAPALETAEEAPAAEQGFGTSAFDTAPTPTVEKGEQEEQTEAEEVAEDVAERAADPEAAPEDSPPQDAPAASE